MCLWHLQRPWSSQQAKTPFWWQCSLTPFSFKLLQNTILIEVVQKPLRPRPFCHLVVQYFDIQFKLKSTYKMLHNVPRSIKCHHVYLLNTVKPSTGVIDKALNGGGRKLGTWTFRHVRTLFLGVRTVGVRYLGHVEFRLSKYQLQTHYDSADNTHPKVDLVS